MRARHPILAASLVVLLGGPACFLQADAEISIGEKGVSAKSGLYTDEVAFADMKGVTLSD